MRYITAKRSSDLVKNGGRQTYQNASIRLLQNAINDNLPQASERSDYKMPVNSDGDLPSYDKMPYNSGTSIDRSENTRRKDVRLMKLLYTAVNETMLPYVEAVIDEYEYVGSPIFSDDGPDRETIAQLTDRVLLLAAGDIDEIEEINTEDILRTGWNRKQLLNSIVEALVINEIFAVRRPKYRRIKQNYLYSSGIYDGIAKR